jgi:hypothetical protein
MKNKIFFIPILLLPLLVNGCLGINEEFEGVRDMVILSTGNDYKSEFQFSVGSVGITVSSWVVDASTDDDFPSDILEDVSSVQVGVYKKLQGTSFPNFQTLLEIEPEMQASGWRSILRSYKDDELTGIYIRNIKEEQLNRLFVISLEDDELVLVEVEGDLNEAIATVIREKGIDIDIDI